MGFNIISPYMDCVTHKFKRAFVYGKNPVRLECIVLEKYAWKSVYRISEFTLVKTHLTLKRKCKKTYNNYFKVAIVSYSTLDLKRI